MQMFSKQVCLSPVAEVFSNKNLLARILAFSTLHLRSKVQRGEAWYRNFQLVYEFSNVCRAEEKANPDWIGTTCVFFVCKKFYEVAKNADFWRKCYKVHYNRRCTSRKLIKFTSNFSWKYMFSTIHEIQSWDFFGDQMSNFRAEVLNKLDRIPFILTFYTFITPQKLVTEPTFDQIDPRCKFHMYPDKIVEACLAKCNENIALQNLGPDGTPEGTAPIHTSPIYLNQINTNLIITGILLFLLRNEDIINRTCNTQLKSLCKTFVLKNLHNFIYDLAQLYEVYVLVLDYLESQNKTLEEKFTFLSNCVTCGDRDEFIPIRSSIIDDLYTHDFISVDTIKEIYKICGIVPKEFPKRLYGQKIDLVKFKYIIDEYDHAQDDLEEMMGKIRYKGYLEYIKILYTKIPNYRFKLTDVKDIAVVGWLRSANKITEEQLAAWNEFTARYKLVGRAAVAAAQKEPRWACLLAPQVVQH